MKQLGQWFRLMVTRGLRCATSFFMFFIFTKSILMFLEISTSLLLARTTASGDIDMDKFFRLVDNRYDDRDVDLPKYILHLIWDEDFLNSRHEFDSGIYPIREVMSNKDLLSNNLERVADQLLFNLPILLQIRLGVGSERNHQYLREALVTYMDKKVQLKLS